MLSGGNLSLADIAAVTRNNDGDGFGGNNGWWILIILFALFGWGNNGNGYGAGNGRNCGCDNGVTVVPVPFSGFGGGWGAFDAASMQRGFDTSGIIAKLDGISNGICSLGYDQLAQMNGIGRQIDQAAFAAERTANNNAMFMMQQFNAMGRAQDQCCCETKGLIRDVQYNLEKSDCSIKTLLNQLFQQLQWQDMQNAQNISQLINQKFCDLESAQKDATIADLRTQLAACGDQKTAQWVVNQLSGILQPRAVPAYPAANPNGMGNWGPQVLANGQFQTCGCGGCNPCCA